VQRSDDCCECPAPSPIQGPTDVLDRDAAEFTEALSALLRSERLRNSQETCSFGITMTECYGLETLVRRGPITVQEFAAALRLDKSTASRAAASLERKRLARRGRHPRDGRALAIGVTASGRRLYERIRRASLDCNRRLIGEFDATTRRSMTRLLRRLHDACAAPGALTRTA
jgi:MarR family transcriptional regulator, 2-MHQ and catechol-resistance regulon repressor